MDERRIAVSTCNHPYHDESFATGVWISDDAGQTWRAENDELAMLRADIIIFNSNDRASWCWALYFPRLFTARWPKPWPKEN